MPITARCAFSLTNGREAEAEGKKKMLGNARHVSRGGFVTAVAYTYGFYRPLWFFLLVRKRKRSTTVWTSTWP
jgi:hypothetical protein